MVIETGVLHEVGLRNTLEPDPDNTGVGSFQGQRPFFLESQSEFSCFRQQKAREIHVQISGHSDQSPISLLAKRQAETPRATRACAVRSEVYTRCGKVNLRRWDSWRCAL